MLICFLHLALHDVDRSGDTWSGVKQENKERRRDISSESELHLGMNPVVYLMHLNQKKYHQTIPEIPDTLGACGTSVLKPNVQTETGMLLLPNLAYNPAELLNFNFLWLSVPVCVCVCWPAVPWLSLTFIQQCGNSARYNSSSNHKGSDEG